MYDIQVVFPQVSIDLTRARELPGISPRIIEIIGDDFRSVDEVFINEMVSPSTTIVSKNRMLAQVPDELQYNRISSLEVVSNRLTLSPRSLLKFKVGSAPQRVTGMMRLIQFFLGVFFQSPGSDIFEPNVGGGALKVIGATIGAASIANTIADLTVAVSQTTRQILAIQARGGRIPREEKLLNARVTGTGFNRNETALLLGIDLQNQSGKVGTANIEL